MRPETETPSHITKNFPSELVVMQIRMNHLTQVNNPEIPPNSVKGAQGLQRASQSQVTLSALKRFTQIVKPKIMPPK